MTVAEMLARAISLHQRGEFAQAEQLYRQILASVPNQPEALHFLGVLANQVGKPEVSVKLIEQSLRYKNDAGAWSNYGESLRALGRNDEALAAYDRAIALDPNMATAWSNKGLVLRTMKRVEESEEACRRAIELAPGFGGAYQNLCNVLGDRGKVDEAIEAGKRAAELTPGNSDAHADLGAAYVEAAQLDNAITAFDRAIAIAPENADAHHNLAQALLLSGDFGRGWAEYEWRWKSPSFPSPKRNFPQAQWRGEAIGSKTLLLHAEQGLGDTIMFIRYLPLVRARLPEARIGVEVQGELRELLSGIDGADEWIARGEAVPAFDVHCPILSLPHAFGTTAETIPANVPYLKADAEKSRHWHERLAAIDANPKVGLAWAGRPTHTNDHNRSTTLATFGPLADERVTFVSLQKGPAAAQASSPPAGMRMVDWSAELEDFSDTAALLANLDLVIAVDTSVVHLAGAMGKPVWVLIPFAADWRWLRSRENDSPWYPSMKLFRLSRPGAWSEAIASVRAAL